MQHLIKVTAFNIHVSKLFQLHELFEKEDE